VELRRLAAAVLGAAALAMAQGPEAGSVELAGGAGLVFNGGIHPAVGGAVAVSTTRHLAVGLEVWHVPLGRAALQSEAFEPSRFPRTDSRALDLNGNLHVTIPTRVERVRPYAVFGVGLLHSSFTAMGRRQTATDFRASLGAGLRWYVGERWGFRPEIKVYVPDRTFARLGVCVFYQSR
jgi:hypothetical protein